MTDYEYVTFTDPSNHVAQVLLAHFLILDHVFETWCSKTTVRHFAFSRGITQAWVANIATALPKSFQKHIMWPLGLASRIMEQSC